MSTQQRSASVSVRRPHCQLVPSCRKERGGGADGRRALSQTEVTFTLAECSTDLNQMKPYRGGGALGGDCPDTRREGEGEVEERERVLAG